MDVVVPVSDFFSYDVNTQIILLKNNNQYQYLFRKSILLCKYIYTFLSLNFG